MTDLEKIIKVFNETKIEFTLIEGYGKREKILYDTIICIENDNGAGRCGYAFEILFKNGKKITEGVYV